MHAFAAVFDEARHDAAPAQSGESSQAAPRAIGGLQIPCRQTSGGAQKVESEHESFVCAGAVHSCEFGQIRP